MKFRRILVLSLLVACLAAIPATTLVFADNDESVSICHFPGGKDEGHVITVSQAAVDVHILMHGDTDSYVVEKDGKSCRRSCKIKQCGKGEELDLETCKCVPKGGGCEPQKCAPGYVWSDKVCKCVPTDGACEPQKCQLGEVWSDKLCQCVPSEGPCEPQKCKPDEVWSDKLCQCVPIKK